MLSEDATKFEDEEFYRVIIPAMLKPTICVDYIKAGGKDLRDEDEVLDSIQMLSEGLDTEFELKNSKNCKLQLQSASS